MVKQKEEKKTDSSMIYQRKKRMKEANRRAALLINLGELDDRQVSTPCNNYGYARREW
jgi:hypothetical protein